MNQEQWMPTRHAGYFVSDQGRVKRGSRILKGRRHSNGYVRISPGAGRDAYVHQLVLEAFVGPRPDGWEADHINRDRADNRANNLRWVSVADNRARRVPACGERNGSSKLNAADVIMIRASGAASALLARTFGVSVRHINKIKGGVAWRTL